MRTLSPPITKLPIEVLTEIFLWCIPPFPRAAVEEAPLLLSQVCSTWRQIVYNSPILWSSLHIDITRSNPSGPHRSDAILEWLRRSRNVPLTLSVHQQSLDLIPVEVEQSLLDSRDRWRDVSIDAPVTTIRTLLNSSSVTLDGSLRIVQLRLADSSPPSSSSLDIPSLSISWEYLTTLSVLESDSRHLPAFPCLDDYFTILERCKNLRVCEISATLAFDPHSRTSITLDKLRTLDLVLYEDSELGADRTDQHLGAFIGLLEMPALTSLGAKLVIPAKRRGTPSPLPHRFSQALAERIATLRSLSLAYVPMTEDGLLNCLHRAKSLEHLDLRFGFGGSAEDPISDRVIDALCGDTTTTSLQSLHIECSGARCSEDSLQGILASKFGKLQSFYMKSEMTPSHATSQLLSTLRNNGVNASVEEFRAY